MPEETIIKENNSNTPLLITDAILNDVADHMSEVSPDINHVANPAGSAENTGLVDKDGRAFDATLHETDLAGNPVISKGNGMLKLKRGRKAASQQQQPPENEPESSPEPVKEVQVGFIAAHAFCSVATMLFGDEWRPEVSKDINELDYLTESFAVYFKSQDMDDIPPGIALTIALSMYSLKRFGKPVTQSKISKLKSWALLRFFKLKNKFKVKKPDLADKRDNETVGNIDVAGDIENAA